MFTPPNAETTPEDPIDTVRVLNIDVDASTISEKDLINYDQNNIRKDSFIVSESDEELLILISFKHPINLKSFKMYSHAQDINDDDISASVPKRVHVYNINNLSVNFDDLSSMKAAISVDCTTSKLQKGQTIKLQKSSKTAHKFNQIKYLAIYIDSNQDGTETTLINGIIINPSISTASKATISTTKEQKHKPSIEEQEYKNEKSLYSLPRCARVSIKKGARCEHVDNVMKCLCFYQSLDIENNVSDRDEMVRTLNDRCKAFLDDYVHMILNHSHEIEAIYHIILSMPNMNECELSNCAFSMRHHRDREKEANDIDARLEKEVTFWRDTMDACHCYVYHLYDFGLRIKTDDIKTDTDDCVSNFDASFAAISEHMKAIKRKLGTLKHFKFTRYDSNKFALNVQIYDELLASSKCTFMDELYKYMTKYLNNKKISRIQTQLDAEEYDSESIKLDIAADQESNIRKWFDDNHYLMQSAFKVFKDYIIDVTLSEFSFKIGYQFYYWKDYQDSQFYVQPKYNSLKEEIQNNTIHALDHYEFMVCLQKAQRRVNTAYARKTTAQRYWGHVADDPNRFGIHTGTPISEDHLLSVILYTDRSKLSREFSATFRSKAPFEPLSSIKNRNGEFAVWSRLLQETVYYFGNMGDPTNNDYFLERKWKDLEIETGPFYCGVSRVLVIPEFNIQLNSPTSTTKHIEVAQRFAGESGLIIQLNNDGYRDSYRLPSWNCSWLSAFPEEDERLWMAGISRIKIETVRIIGTTKNYRRYFKSLFRFDSMLTGVLPSTSEQKPTDKDSNILSQLVMYKTTRQGAVDDYPPYILWTFEAYAKNKTRIDIRLGVLRTWFEKLNDLIMTKIVQRVRETSDKIEFKLDGQKTTNLLKPKIFKLFDNLKTIIIDTTHPDGNHIDEYRMDLLSLLSLLSKSDVYEVEMHAMHQYIIQKKGKYGVAQKNTAYWSELVGFAVVTTFYIINHKICIGRMGYMVGKRRDFISHSKCSGSHIYLKAFCCSLIDTLYIKYNIFKFMDRLGFC
eukprot:166363_1